MPRIAIVDKLGEDNYLGNGQDELKKSTVDLFWVICPACSGYDQRIQINLGKLLCSCLGRQGLKFSVNWKLCFGTQ